MFKLNNIDIVNFLSPVLLRFWTAEWFMGYTCQHAWWEDSAMW